MAIGGGIDLPRRQIASYGRDRILIADLCPINSDEFHAGKLLNLADLITAAFAKMGQYDHASMCCDEYCIEIERVAGGFIAYEVRDELVEK